MQFYCYPCVGALNHIGPTQSSVGEKTSSITDSMICRVHAQVSSDYTWMFCYNLQASCWQSSTWTVSVALHNCLMCSLLHMLLLNSSCTLTCLVHSFELHYSWSYCTQRFHHAEFEGQLIVWTGKCVSWYPLYGISIFQLLIFFILFILYTFIYVFFIKCWVLVQ